MIERMKENEIKTFEDTAEDYGLESYPISGVQLAALISTLRFYEEAAERAMPHLEYALNRQKAREIGGKYILPRLGALLLSIALTFSLLAGAGYSDIFPETGGGALIVIILAVLIPAAFALIPLMIWIDKKAARDWDATNEG